MIQTLQALFAFVLLLTSGLGMQRHRIASQTGQIQSEIALRATGVSTQLFDTFALLPFDGNGSVETSSDLTAPADFGGVDALAAALDLDDIDGLAGEITLSTDGTALTYQWTASVRYVTQSGGSFTASPGATPTFMKEVELTIAGPASVSITTNRIYTYSG